MPRLKQNASMRRPHPWTEEPGLSGAAARFWQRSYAPDYLGFAFLLTAYMLIRFFVEPFHRMFSLDDLAKQFPHADVERVPVTWNIAYGALCPLVLILLWAVLMRPSFHHVHVTILGLLISLALSTFITDVIKNAVGRPRPDLIARCKPEKGTPAHELVTIVVCTETNHHVLHDGWRSFPSGHSSFAFSGLGYLSFFLAGQMHVFRPRTDLARVLIALAPLLGAALIAISRLEDYRHDVYDVTCGSILGISMAFFSYRRYYPSLRSNQGGVPYPGRGHIPGSNRFNKVKDDEEQSRAAEEYSLDDLTEDAETLPLTNANTDAARAPPG